jgi:uncharacterized protein
MLFVSKQKDVEAQLAQYRAKVAQCLDGFRHAFQQYFQTSDRTALHDNYQATHGAESQADDLRRAVEVMMYSKSIFPESRGDIMGLLEAMDKMPNRAEEAVRMMLNQYVVVPEAYQEAFLELVEVNHRSVMGLLAAAEKLFSDFTHAAVAVGRVDEMESESDHLQAALIDRIFGGDLEGVHKLLLRDLAGCISEISDRAQAAGDRIRIIVAKRRM